LAALPTPQNIHDDEHSPEGGSVHLGRPLLTFAGEKLYAGWMQRFLDGTLPYKPRPALQGRMPAFAPFADGLAKGLAHQHGYRAESAPMLAVDAGLAEIGRRLTLVDGGFSCVACHSVGAQRALAGSDTATVSFNFIAERLRSSYYWRYVRDPVRLVPSTMMPRFIGDDGTTPIKSVFNGDPERQFEAIWHYLMSLRMER
jgi:mono/diheme cytochrome c family protein